MIRINKYLADNNIASRREGDELIETGKVFVNGKKAVLGQMIRETDTVEVKNNTKEYAYFAYNKPVGVVTTNAQKGEIDIVHRTKFPTKVFPIGRLDKDSHGLILLSNDGRITKKLLDPEFEHEKEYEVEVDKHVTPEFFKKMTSGVRIERYTTKPAKLEHMGSRKFSIILTEGKNRQIRRMCQACGYTVKDLKRVRFGKITLGKMKPGEWRKLEGSEI